MGGGLDTNNSTRHEQFHHNYSDAEFSFFFAIAEVFFWPQNYVFFPTGNPKPEHSGSGKPDRFDRLPVETGQIQNWIKKTQFNRFVPVFFFFFFVLTLNA